MLPFGNTCTAPSPSRRTIVRRLISSTLPVTPLMRARSPTRTWSSRMMKNPEMTSRTRFWAPKPTASPAMPAPVRIGTTSIVSSRRSISMATKLTVTVTRLARTPPSVLARRCHSRSVCAVTADSLCCRWTIARFAARITIVAPTTMTMMLMPWRRSSWPAARGSTRGVVDAELRQRQRDARQRRPARRPGR